MSGPVIRTYTGLDVPLMTFTPEHVVSEDIAHALAHQCRWGGHTRRFYSLAEHCLLVAALVPPAHRLYALLHDASEAYLGDIVAPLKRSTALEGYREVEARVQTAIYRAFGLDPGVPDTVHAADLVALELEGRALFDPPIDRAWLGPAWGFSAAHQTLKRYGVRLVVPAVRSSAEAKVAWLAQVRCWGMPDACSEDADEARGSVGRPTRV